MIEVAGANGTEAMGVSGNNVVGLYLIPYMHQGIQAYTYQGFEYNTVSQVYRTLSVPGSVLTVAAGIDGNNIVGWYGSGAFLYDGSSYTLLNAPPGSVAGQFVAYGISGNNIVGYYEPVGNGYQGYLATPIPEPSGMGLLALGSVVIVIYGGRRSREKVSPKSSPNEH